MKRIFFLAVIFAVFVSLLLTLGCAQQKAASSKEAIDTANAMESVEQKVDYLIKQAKAFYRSKEFQEAVNTAQYILRNLDKDSQIAKDLIQKAKDALAQTAKSAAEDVKKKLPGFGQ